MSTNRNGRALTDSEIAQAIASELSGSEAYSASNQRAFQEKALQYYNAGPRGDEALGGSKLVSADVADMTEAILAQMAPMIADSTISFQPNSEEDEDAAQKESNAVKRAIFQTNPGFIELTTACKDAVLMRNGIMRVEVQQDEETHDADYYEIDSDAITTLLTERQPNEVGRELVGDPEPIEVQEGEQLYNVTVRHHIRHERLDVASIKPENVRIESEWDKVTLDGLRFFAIWSPIERGELLEAGVAREVINELPPYTSDANQVTLKRMPNGTNNQLGGYDWSTELVGRWDTYLRIDANGDGIAELWRYWYAGQKLIKAEEVPFIPYCLGVVLIRGHTWEGVAASERLFSVQDMKTKIARQWMDNLDYHNNPRPEVLDGQVNLGDMAAGGAARWVRVKTAGAVRDRPIMDVGPSAALALDWADKMRSERGGAALDLQTAEANIAGHTAHGTERQYSSREQLAGMMARTFGETMLRSLYMLVHRVMRTHMQQELSLKFRGEWQRTDPREWTERLELDVHMGQSQKDHDRRLGLLREILGQQYQALQAGGNGELVDLSKMHNTLTQFIEAAGIPAPDMYWIDPRSPQAVQASQQKARKAEEDALREEKRTAALLEASLGFEEYRVNVQSEDKDLDRDADIASDAAKLTLEYDKLAIQQEDASDAAD